MTFDEKFGVPALLLILAFCAAAVLTSANHYLEVTTFDLRDAGQGRPVALDYAREIKRDFDATWRVDLYRDGVWIATAEAPNVHTYRTTAVLPEHIDLGWLTYGNRRFDNLACGDYSVAVQWFINPESIIWRRVVEVHDDFRVFCP